MTECNIKATWPRNFIFGCQPLGTKMEYKHVRNLFAFLAQMTQKTFKSNSQCLAEKIRYCCKFETLIFSIALIYHKLDNIKITGMLQSTSKICVLNTILHFWELKWFTNKFNFC